MSEPTIKINPAKACEIEFEVSVQGSEVSEPPIVRFVMSGCDEYLCTFECVKVEGVKWSVKIPPLSHFTKTTVPFHVEVIVDGYYFEPAEGTVQLITNPSVKFQPVVSAKPTVTTSFTVKQDDEKPAKPEKKVSEAASAATITGQYAPTNGLLKPEEEPTQSSVKIGNATKDDEHIDHTRLSDISSSVLPGETTDPEPQRGNNEPSGEEGDDEEFDPKRVAEGIVSRTIGGSAQKPTTQGTLFKRGKDGKAVIEGIDSPAAKAEKASKAAKVKEILSGQ
jgi:hypothetical protein